MKSFCQSEALKLQETEAMAQLAETFINALAKSLEPRESGQHIEFVPQGRIGEAFVILDSIIEQFCTGIKQSFRSRR